MKTALQVADEIEQALHVSAATQRLYARERLTAALEVLAEIETHADLTTRTYYGARLRAALGVGDVKLICSCAACEPER